MKTIVFHSVLLAGMVGSQFAAAEETITPPAGWEIPAAPATTDKPAKEKKKKVGPACCAFDSTCCSRQADIDAQANPSHVTRMLELHIADLPEASIREVAKEGAPIEDAPPIRLVNEDGKPFPWESPPKEIRALPPGPVGTILWNSEWGTTPSFDDDEFKAYGWGEVHYVKDPKTYRNDAEIVGKVEYVSVQQGEGDKLLFDIARGTVSGSPKLKATYHLHVQAVHVADKTVHAYRSVEKDHDETLNWVDFLMPQTIDGFESKDAKHEGGLFPSRFSRQWSYSLYRLPYGPGRSNLATFRMDDDDKRRWVGVSKQRSAKIWRRNMLVSASQTSVESEPRIRVVYFEEFAFSF